jgi:hypothetical protein
VIVKNIVNNINSIIKTTYKNKILVNYFEKNVLNTYIPQKSKFKFVGDLNFSILE